MVTLRRGGQEISIHLDTDEGWSYGNKGVKVGGLAESLWWGRRVSLDVPSYTTPDVIHLLGAHQGPKYKGLVTVFR